jgi:DNA gyrase subunit B
LVGQYRKVMALIERMSQAYPTAILNTLVHSAALAVDSLSDRAAVTAWSETLQSQLAELDNGSHRYQVTVREDAERGLFEPLVTITAHGVPNDYALQRQFFESSEYRAMTELGATLYGLIEEGAYVRRGERQQPVANFAEALNWLMAESRRGINTQRYKGLGEMNPGQLWETTMDPEGRRMLRVTIEDAIAADQMFTTLMGDHVEPRRAFIETNALSVVNLDI